MTKFKPEAYDNDPQPKKNPDESYSPRFLNRRDQMVERLKRVTEAAKASKKARPRPRG